jgi:cytochrome c-type biogenesis protein
MELGIGSYGLDYVTGVLSILSPCVLPLVPIVLGTASSTHRFGPLALTAGLSFSFTAIGLFIAVAGAALGIDETVFRSIAATHLILIGSILMSSGLQARLALATSGIGNWGQQWLARLTFSGLRGQFVVGSVLGAVWSPCIGPTLGAAAVLAAQGRDPVQASIVMATFGAGAGTSMMAPCHVR